ncbi:MAG: hypothetical protein ACI9TF_001159 [Paracrocinitomix sp.]
MTRRVSDALRRRRFRAGVRRDLRHAPYATLATVGTAGRPQMSTVCFLASEHGTVQLLVNSTRQKALNMVDKALILRLVWDPSVDRDVINLDATLRQEFLDVSARKALGQVPANRQQDQLRRKTCSHQTPTGQTKGRQHVDTSSLQTR